VIGVRVNSNANRKVEAVMAVQIQNQLLDAMKKIDRPGTFCTSGRLPAVLPGLEVASVGSVALPLEKRQATALKKCARQAPYGKGTETLVNTNVRRVWEIDADQVTLTNPEWAGVLAQAIRAAQSDLGLENQTLDAHLYKLLLYEAGSFFLAHRDGEKLDRMVATLIVALPAVHEGGQLVVRHEGSESTVDFGRQSRFHTQFAAFYADCEHEVRPVTSGFRLSLVYNLTLARSKRTIAAPRSSEHIAAVARILHRWNEEVEQAAARDQEHSPSKLAILLDHEYSAAGLAFDALKGIDRAKVRVLFAAARQTGIDASLSLVTHWESGSAEPSGHYGYGRGRGYDFDYDEGAHEMGEVFEENVTAQRFRDADGKPLAFGRIRLDKAEIVSETPVNEGEPDKEDFEGYTGNAGMTLERWYHRAAVMLWPEKSRFDVLCKAGVEAAVGGLERMVKQWNRAPETEQPAIKQECLEFADRIIAHWPERAFASSFSGGYDHREYDFFDEDDSDTVHDDGGDNGDDDHLPEHHDHKEGSRTRQVSLLSLLATLGDASLVSKWIRNVLAKDASLDPGKEMLDVCRQHGWFTFEDDLLNLFESTSNETIERHVRLLADWSQCKDKSALRGRLCALLAQRIVSAMERWLAEPAKHDWRAKKVSRAELLPPLAESLIALGETELFEQLTTTILDPPKRFDFTTVQIPALLQMERWLRRNVKRPCAPLHRWLAAVVEELESRASHPPQEPTDWRRESDTGCSCADCKELSRFLRDPSMKTLRLPLAKDRRQHLHAIIDGKNLDTTHVTERSGRPFTLVCAKTQASFERTLRAHHLDLEHLTKIRNLYRWLDGLKSDQTRKKSLKPRKST
jgi:hypothetical protein